MERCSIEQGRLRVYVPKPLSKKRVFVDPVGKGDDLWCTYRDAARRENHPEPERVATSILRLREKVQDMETKRHRIIQIEPPSVSKPTPNTKKLPSASVRCKATKMDGKQCEFKCHPDCGAFCSKHAVKNICKV